MAKSWKEVRERQIQGMLGEELLQSDNLKKLVCMQDSRKRERDDKRETEMLPDTRHLYLEGPKTLGNDALLQFKFFLPLELAVPNCKDVAFPSTALRMLPDFVIKTEEASGAVEEAPLVGPIADLSFYADQLIKSNNTSNKKLITGEMIEFIRNIMNGVVQSHNVAQNVVLILNELESEDWKYIFQASIDSKELTLAKLVDLLLLIRVQPVAEAIVSILPALFNQKRGEDVSSIEFERAQTLCKTLAQILPNISDGVLLQIMDSGFLGLVFVRTLEEQQSCDSVMNNC